MMKRSIIVLFILFCFQFGKAQIVNDKFPLGHYQVYLDRYLFAADFFESGKVKFKISKISAVDSPSKEYPTFYGTYRLENDSLRFKSDENSGFFQVSYKYNPNLEKDRILIATDSTIYDYGTRLYLASGRNLKKSDYKNMLDSFVDFELGYGFYLDSETKPGDTLVLKIDNYDSSINSYYVIPQNANEIFIKAYSSPSDGLLMDWLTGFKGESENEIKLIYSLNKESNDPVFALYYTRPANPDDEIQKLPSGREKGYESLKAEKIIDIKDDSDEEYEPSDSNIVVEEDYGNESLVTDTLKYYTSYYEALKVAKKENKFLRAFVIFDDECLTNMKEKVHELNKDISYYSQEYLKVGEYYVIGIFSGEEAKELEKYGVRDSATNVFIAPDGSFLYASPFKSCEDNLESVFYYDEFYRMPLANSQLLLKYNKDILVPKIQKTKNVDRKLLKTYLDNVFLSIDDKSYGDSYNLKSLGYYVNSYPLFLENKTNEDVIDNYDKLPDFFPTTTEIGGYLDLYVNQYMKSPADTTLARMILDYYDKIYDSSMGITNIPSSIEYLMRNLNAFKKIPVDGSNFAEVNNIFYQIFQPFYSISNRYDSSEKPDTLNSNSLLLPVYKKAIELLPEYKDYFVMAYSYQVSYGFITDSFAEKVSFFDDYMNGILRAKDKKEYIAKCAKNMEELSPLTYSELCGSCDDSIDGLSEHLILLLNNTAWAVYRHEPDSQYVPKALEWAKVAVDLATVDNYIYLDTYAHLLYRAGKKEEAIVYQKQACELLKDNPDSYLYKDISLALKLMKYGLLGSEDFKWSEY